MDLDKEPPAPDVTLTIMIGNSDDRLTQAQWSEFCQRIDDVCRGYQKHFAASSDGKQPWQNACWVFDIPADMIDRFKRRIKEIRKIYRQESVAIVHGSTEFI